MGDVTREEAIKLLEHCLTMDDCDNCPQINDGNCFESRIKMMLDLLKPHVLTLAEADDADVCWYEVKSVDRMPPCRVRWFDGCNEVTVYRFIANPEYPLEEEYCETWRLWSARPSREQREETAWLG